ncbi:uncharacterized protein DUF3987 [Nitrosospira multiformis]|uniref:Uncharacterized protein DUF3987 n=1 Tax=Nitrosospira multiformis TaxID=1231 RepID=A0A2T5I645_9PROT|nr:YfjI family protein [Nitrosospira multiformis]PTQ79304.1 uncharacterized protein DUF3987 [Nitrosospira multiformis]
MNKAIERGQSFLDEAAERIRSRRIEEESTARGVLTRDAWPEPGEIKGEPHPVPPFEAETLLPPVLREWVMDEADRMPCPPDFVAVAAVVALGSLIGARCAIKPKSWDDWLIVPNLWGGVVGLPSAKKSPAISAALKPLERLIAQAREKQEAELEVFEANKTVFEAQTASIQRRIKGAVDGAKDVDLSGLKQELQHHLQQATDGPIPRRYKTNDTTIEKLGELLRDNPDGLLVLRDELVGLLSSWERYGREGERAFYLEAWNGNSSFDTDRIGRGSIFIPNLCVSIFGGIQPDKLTAYLEQIKNALANDGMLQRFQLLVYPDHRKWEWRDRAPNMEARNWAFAIFETLAKFDPVAWGAAPADEFIKFPHFHFNGPAQELFIKWSTELHTKRLPAEGDSLMAQHLGKFDKLFPALALIFHLVECATTGRRGAVSKDTALRAAAWCEYLEAHARRCYGLLADTELCAAQAMAKKLLHGDLADGFTVRDVIRKQWSGLKTKPAIQAGLALLEEEAWLRSEDIDTGGRPTRRYWINPRISELDKTEEHDD